MARWIVLISFAIALTGCQVEQHSDAGGTGTNPETAAPKEGQTPPMMQVKENPEETKQLATLKEEHDTTKAEFEKKKDDAGAKKEYVDATVAFATATMMAESLPPRQKYPDALRLYREALEVDPKNDIALENKKMIEDIYKSMSKPIPE